MSERTEDLTEGKPLSGKMLGSAQFQKEVVLLKKEKWTFITYSSIPRIPLRIEIPAHLVKLVAFART